MEFALPVCPERPPLVVPQEPNAPDCNREQAQAIEHFEGPLLIAAGPGTGKTHTLTHRVVALIKKRGVSASRILAVTFTNKAAREMRERIEKALADVTGSSLPTIVTFHALCLSILRDEAAALGLPQDFSILDDAQRLALVDRKGDLPQSQTRSLLDQISFLKQGTGRPKDIVDDQLAAVWRRYEQEKSAVGALDLDDLVRKVVMLFEQQPELLTHYRNRWRHLLVDEYQDVNAAQYRLLRLLAPDDANLCVIGDPDQAIYGFRGASHLYFLQFTKDYPQAKVVSLSENYRSTGSILDASYQVVEKNSRRMSLKTWTAFGTGEQIRLVRTSSEKSEAQFVAREIEKLIGGVSHFSMDADRCDGQAESPMSSFSDIAVLYRLHAMAGPVKKVLDNVGIPVQSARGIALFDHAPIRKIMSLAKAVAFPNAGHSVPGKLAASVAHLRHEADSLCVPEVIERIIALAGIGLTTQPPSDASRLLQTRLARLAQRAQAHEGTLRQFCDAASLHARFDEFDPRAQRVNLMSLHAAKGLEFNVVFVIGCEMGLLPWLKPDSPADALEQERRLFFVGMTRAKHRLYLTHTKSRFLHGERKLAAASPFLQDIERSLTSLEKHGAGRRFISMHPKKQLNFFER